MLLSPLLQKASLIADIEEKKRKREEKSEDGRNLEK